MDSKEDRIDFKCAKCSRLYSISLAAWNARKKNNNYVCKSCHTSESIKNHWKNMSDDKKRIRSEKLSKSVKSYFDNLNVDERDKLSKRTKDWHNNLTDEQKKNISDKQKEYWRNLPEEKMQAYRQSKSDYYNNLSDEEKILYSERIKEGWRRKPQEEKDNFSRLKKEWYENLSNEEKQAFSDRSKMNWINFSDETRNKIINKQKEWWNNLSEEERIDHSNRTKELWDNMSSEERQKFIENRMQWYWKLSDEERALHVQKSHRWQRELSDEERERLKEVHSNITKSTWNKMSDSERESRIQKIKLGWENLSDENKRIRSERIRSWYDHLTSEERLARTKHILTSTNGTNKLHKKFETMFNESHLVNEYYYEPEEVLTNNDVIHSWDYGIYDKNNNSLVAVVDLDGKFFHADECDYNGIHSREEYDEKRSLSVPNNVKIHIINELNFTKTFESMIQSIMLDYDAFVNKLFKELRAMPFPYPKYNDKGLIKSWNDLCRMNCNDKYHNSLSLNTRVGDRLITNFHESIYHAHTKGNISPYEAWYDDELLLKVIKNRIIYQTYLNPNKILQGFNIAKIATKVSVFSAGRAKMLVNKYLSEHDTIFDPFSGFSGRMLGTISLGKKYIGQDISEIHVRESNNMIRFLTNYSDIDATVNQVDILSSSGEYECLFTCPPYSDKEQWLEVPTDTRSCDDWIDICINNFKCNRYLFVVDITEKYKNNIVDEIKNKSHFNGNSEYVVLIDK